MKLLASSTAGYAFQKQPDKQDQFLGNVPHAHRPLVIGLNIYVVIPSMPAALPHLSLSIAFFTSFFLKTMLYHMYLWEKMRLRKGEVMFPG